MSDGSLRPMRPIKRVPFVEEVLPLLDPVLNPEAYKGHGKPAPPAHGPCAGFGLNTPGSAREFAHGFKGLQKAWPTLTGAQRRRQIEDLANAQLRKSGVPHVGILPSDLPTDDGQLSFENWKLAINKNLLNGNHLSEAQAKELATTVYHESRHAEQWYLMAQRKAADLSGAAGGTPAQQAQAIHDALGIEAGAAKQAQQHPLGAHDKHTPCAQALNDSVYGAHAAHRTNALQNSAKTAAAYNHAQAHFENVNRHYEGLRLNPHADPGAVQRAYEAAAAAGKQASAAYATQQKAYQTYRQLPEEADAFEAENEMAKFY